MFHTPIDQGGGGAPLLFFFFLFPTQSADGSPLPGDKINQTRSSFLILSAELPPGAALPSSITAVELGKGEEPWLYPQLFLFHGEICGSELRMLPGRATGWAEMMSGI